jgi:hypothetical protein
MRESNLELMEGLARLGVVRREHGVADSGEPPWKGMPKFARLVRPLLDSFYQID